MEMEKVAYRIPGSGYQFLFTLPVTQFACERSFSDPKYIKSRAKSTNSEERMGDILMSLDSDIVVELQRKVSY